MNVKNNKRKRESIEKIERVFIELLQTKDMDKISVSDICKRAALNRSTFYANFIDIYDLADKLRTHLEEDFLSLYQDEISQRHNTHNYIKLLSHIRENQLFYKTYFKLGYDNKSLIGYDVDYAAKHFDLKYIDYHIEFFKSGFNALIKKWLEGGCKETPKEIQQILKVEYSGRVVE